MVAAIRRVMMPTVLTSPTATIAAAAATATPAWSWPVSNRGVTARSTTWPSTHDWATVPTA